MNNFGSIDTDAAIGTILSNFSSEYIYHIIEDSLKMKFRPFNSGMPNMVDVLKRQFTAVYAQSPDYREKVEDTESETYQEIIKIICDNYNLTFTADLDSIDIQQLYAISRILYDVFISRFTDYMINFFVSYIVNNADSIYNYLIADENIKKPKNSGAYTKDNFVDPKFIIIHANIDKVIYNMASYDISLMELIQYFLDPESAYIIGNSITDNGDIYKNYYASYILDQRYSAGVLTNIKLNLQSRTLEAKRINTN